MKDERGKYGVRVSELFLPPFILPPFILIVGCRIKIITTEED